jgi:DNA-binding CsgD family transcriptional regulator
MSNKVTANTKVIYRKYWTEDDVNLLNKYKSEGLTNQEIGVILNKTTSNVYSKLKRLEYESAPRFHATWTNDEIEILKQDNIDFVLFCQKYQRGLNQVWLKSYKLKNVTIKTGNHKTVKWTAKDLNKLIKLRHEGKSIKECADILKRTTKSVACKFSLYQDIKQERFAENWTDEEDNILKSGVDLDEFCKKFKRGRKESADRRYMLTTYTTIKRESKRNYHKRTRHIKSLNRQLYDIINVKIKEYDDVPKKHYVQNTLYKSLSNINCSLLTLLGPTPERFIDMLNKYNIVGDNFIYSHEIDLDIFIKVVKKLINKNINLTYGDISAAYPQRLIDLDLMGQWSTQSSLIRTLFNKQSSLDGEKYLMFTLSARGIENLNIATHIAQILKELLDIDVSIDTELVQIENIKQLTVDKFHISNSPYIIEAYRYADTSPMISILIKH